MMHLLFDILLMKKGAQLRYINGGEENWKLITDNHQHLVFAKPLLSSQRLQTVGPAGQHLGKGREIQRGISREQASLL